MLPSPKDRTYVEIEDDELKRIVDTARRRATSLRRGRAAFSCRVTEAGRKVKRFGQVLPAGFTRIEYRWDWTDGNVWQATAFDADGAVVCDAACDGRWVDAGGKRWDVRYAHEFHMRDEEGEDIYDQDDSQDDRRNEARTELQLASRPEGLAEAHLITRDVFSMALYDNPTKMGSPLYRDLETGEVCSRHPTFEPTQRTLDRSLWVKLRWKMWYWDWFRWRWANLLGSKENFGDFLYAPDRKLLGDFVVAYDPDGLFPKSWYAWNSSIEDTLPHDFSNLWREPIDLEDGVRLSRIYEQYKSVDDDTLLYTSSLVLDECAFGDVGNLGIRAVDYSKPQVDW